LRLAILGGSFNPVHIGHLFLADTALTGFGYDRVILIPAFQSPFKIGAEGASPSNRLEMLMASIPGDPRLTIDDCEIRRQGVSFTIDTIHEIIERYRPEGKPGLILGDDLASTFEKWQSPAEIAELVDIIIARRITDPVNAPLAEFPYPHKALNNELMSVSSQMIREKISSGDNWRYLVPPGARNLIEDRFLYGFTRTFNEVPVAAEPEKDGIILAETIIRIEDDARAGLSASRFMHSRHTALMAWDLCRRFGLDAQKGYLAGIAHDMCKHMGEKELVRLARADGGGSTKLEKEKPSLLHARAAAVLVRRKYGIDDQDILEAIRCHTTGGKGMGDIAKVVYVADKIEVSRQGIDPVLRNMSRSADLDTLFGAVFNNTVARLRSRELDLSYGTKRLLVAMHKRNKP